MFCFLLTQFWVFVGIRPVPLSCAVRARAGPSRPLTAPSVSLGSLVVTPPPKRCGHSCLLSHSAFSDFCCTSFDSWVV